jgi:hypothetical protein
MGTRFEVFLFYVAVSVATELLMLRRTHPTPGEKLAVPIHIVFGALLGYLTPEDTPPQYQLLLLVALFIANIGRLAGRWFSLGIDSLRTAIDERYENVSNTGTG